MLAAMAEPRIRNAARAHQTTGAPAGSWAPLERPAVVVHVELEDGRVLDLPGRAMGWRRNPDVVQVEVVVDSRTLIPWMPAAAVTRRAPVPEDSF